MSARTRFNYYRRIFAAYLTPRTSQLTFWHETPEVNERLTTDSLSEYYMTFAHKADYSGDFDARGIPLLNYHGKIGLQYNPIAIAQYGLGNYNLYLRTESPERRNRFLTAADWLVDNLETNDKGFHVWHHHFDWDYRTTLRAPWYSGVAQGQGVSVLVRAHRETGNERYLGAAQKAFLPFLSEVAEGGVTYVDESGRVWLEEYVVDPPTHILNGFMWALWGVHDYDLGTGDSVAKELFDRSVDTLQANLHLYDAGYWSLYEQSGTRMKMLASPFYHSLHIVQLEVLHRLTGIEIFRDFARRWEKYRASRIKRTAALAYKVAFKLLYY